jgi:hypothetical protein
MSIGSLFLGFNGSMDASEDDLMQRRWSAALEKECEVDALLDLLDDDELRWRIVYVNMARPTKVHLSIVLYPNLADLMLLLSKLLEMMLCVALCRKVEKLKCFIARLQCGLAHWKSCALIPCTSCDGMLRKNNDLSFSLACLKSKNEIKIQGFFAMSCLC